MRSPENQPHSDRRGVFARIFGTLTAKLDAWAVELRKSEDPRQESRWIVDTGEGRGMAAASKWVEDIDVVALLHSPMATAAFEARIAVDCDPTIPDEERAQAVVDRYVENLAPLTALPEQNNQAQDKL